jgi:hypothetical protein
VAAPGHRVEELDVVPARQLLLGEGDPEAPHVDALIVE